VRLLGPLEPEAARDLALMPMQRLGVTYADPTLPAQIAARAGGYPSFVQLLCDAALEVLREVGSGDLSLTAEHIAQAEDKVGVELRSIFYANTDQEAQLIAYLLVDRDALSIPEIAEALEGALGRAMPREVVEKALQQLRLLGFATESNGRISWTIPLLRDALRKADARGAATQLAEELGRSP
jgi:hypothetical protein